MTKPEASFMDVAHPARAPVAMVVYSFYYVVIQLTFVATPPREFPREISRDCHRHADQGARQRARAALVEPHHVLAAAGTPDPSQWSLGTCSATEAKCKRCDMSIMSWLPASAGGLCRNLEDGSCESLQRSKVLALSETISQTVQAYPFLGMCAEDLTQLCDVTRTFAAHNS